MYHGDVQIYFVLREGPNKQYSSIDADNGLAPVRRQVIIWTNDG